MTKIGTIFLNFFAVFRCFLDFRQVFSGYYGLAIAVRAFGYPIGWKNFFFEFGAFVILKNL